MKVKLFIMPVVFVILAGCFLLFLYMWNDNCVNAGGKLEMEKTFYSCQEK